LSGYGTGTYGTWPCGGPRHVPWGEVAEDATVIPATGKTTATFAGVAVGRVVIADQVVTVDERQGVGIIMRDVFRSMGHGTPGRDAEAVARLQAVVDTLRAHRVVPRPSWKVIGWTLGEINQFSVGLSSGVAASYFP
jgi:hypothetical protein